MSNNGKNSEDVELSECQSCPDEKWTSPTAADGEGVDSSTRRYVLGTLGALSATSLMTGTGSAGTRDESKSGANEGPPKGPAPTVEGPITGGSATGEPQLSAVSDLSKHGYVEEEYFISGRAHGLESLAGGKRDDASYTTRIVVWRPAHRSKFNGTLLADWPNVSTQVDVPVTWINADDYLMREGYAVAMISAQEVGVQDSAEGMDLVTWDPERYGDLHHPGDDYAFDIFSQAIRTLRGDSKRRKSDPDPMGDLEPKRVLATGVSQSAGFLHTYINALQEHLGLIDGFLPATAGTIIDEQPVRDDVAPVLWLNSEDEADAEQRPDDGQFRLWEVAGASHVNRWLSASVEIALARDLEGETIPWEPAVAGQYGQLEDGVYGECEYNYFPMRYAYRSALEHLNEWVKTGEKPARAPKIERAGDGVARDEYGNARGGVRLPPINVPVAEYDAMSCELFGQTFRFDEQTLSKLYSTPEEYRTNIAAATDDAVENGYLLPADAADLMRRAKDSPIGHN